MGPSVNSGLCDANAYDLLLRYLVHLTMEVPSVDMDLSSGTKK